MKLTYKCKICEKQFLSNKSLITHINFSHKMIGKVYYDTYIEPDIDHKCVVCKTNFTKFISLEQGYSKTCCVTCANKINGRYEKISKTLREINNKNKKQITKPFEITKDTDLSDYRCTQKFLYKCENCGCLKTVYKNFIKEKDFLCHSCKLKERAIKNGKILTTNERVLVDRNTDLTRYFTNQKVIFKCEKCGKEQHASIMYLRQTTRKDSKFLCQNCTTIQTNNKIYGVNHVSELFVSPKYISKQSIRFFNDLYNIIDYKDGVLYNTKEYGMRDISGEYYKYDFTITKQKIIIEYNGDYWHPSCLNDPSWKNNRLDCNETFKHDLNKKICAENKGFKIFYIWEHDVNECYSECLSKCKRIIEGDYEIC